MSAAWWDTVSVSTFRSVAKQVIALVDDRDALSAPELLHRAHDLLPQLYVAGLRLPSKPAKAYDESEDEANAPAVDAEQVARHHERWQLVFTALGERWGSRWDHYQEVFDPYADPPEATVTGSLADDLSDIYLDLLEGAELWAASRQDEAVWEWRFGFETHWGEHVTGALRAIRTLAATYDLGFPNSQAPDV
jgi:hypothetical protein